MPETRTIAVFGSSEPRPGQTAYELARSVGSRLAAAGFAVLNGGYGGVMEASSRGAVEAGGRCAGVTCEIFGERGGNPYLSEEQRSPDLYDRTRQLIEGADGFLVLPGKAGTLAELSMLWALQRAGCLGTKPVVLLGESWGLFVAFLERESMLEPGQLEITRIAASPDEAVQQLTRLLDAGPERA